MKRPASILIALSLLAARGGAETRHFDPHQPVDPIFQQLHSPAGPPASMLAEPHDPYRLGSGDKLELELMEVPDTRQISIVMPDGDLYFQTAHVHAAGMTITELKAAIESQLKTDYRDPQLSLILRSMTSQRVEVMGRVNNPGILTLDTPTTLVEAISRAGGLMIQRSGINSEELADLHHSFIVRDGKLLPVNFVKLLRDGDASQNIFLKDGDFIYLPSSAAGRVYVLGAVNLSRGIDYSEELTLVTAIAGAQGLAPRSYPQHVVIIRDSLTEPKVAVVNLKAMLNGKARDVRLQPQDIVWVPNSPFDRVESIVGGIVSTFARTVSVNEGNRAVISSAQPVQPSIGIGPAQ
ncbi:MAG TPA: SLBB domain-containing protein [Chthoniobacteraceae bacterium]|jgi:protein involved in polysaccharide export with SLBB domain|nr:SLBB domain-containing protein [Chthoniobacteraceae bacterium]